MRKLKLFLSMLMLIAFSVGNVWAEVSTLTFTAKANGSGTADDGVEWTVTSDGSESNFDNTKGIHYGTGSASVQYIRLSTSGITGTITQVEVNASTASGVSATVGVTVGTTDFKVENSDDITKSLTATATNYTFTGSASGEIVVTVTKPSSATKAIYCKSVAVTYTPGGGDQSTPSAEPESNSIDVDAAGGSGTINVTYSNFEVAASAVLFYDQTGESEVDAPSWMTANTEEENNNIQYSVQANSGEARTAYLKVYALNDDSDELYSSLITISQAEYSVPTGTFELFSGDLEEGDYVICSDATALKNALATNTNYIGYESITVNNDEIENPSKNLVWHIAQSGEYWTIHNVAADNYAASTGAKNKGQVIADGTDDKAMWTATGNSSYEFVNKANTAASVNSNLRYNSGYGFACYSTTTGKSLSLYKKQVAGQPKAPTFSVAGGNYESAQSVELSCETEDATIYYTTNGDAPTSSSTQYNGTAIAVDHTMTIKAIAIKNEISSTVASATYTIIVWQTVADVWDDITADGPTNAHIYGYVSQINVGGYNNNFYISDNGSTEGNQLYAYRMNMNSFSVAVGDKVKLAGDLTEYQGTKEFKYANQGATQGLVVALEAKGALQSVAVSGTPTKTEYASGEDFEPAGLKVFGTYANGFVGEITEGITWGNDLTDGKVTENKTVHVTATVNEVVSPAYDVAVTVAAKTLVSIVATPASYTIYKGQALPEPTIMATYSEGEPADVSAEAIYDTESVFDNTTADTYTITVSYTFGTTKTTTYEVTVEEYANADDAPYTVTEALDIIVNAIGNTESADEIVVAGTVSEEKISNNINRYKISDGENELLVYAGKGFNSGTFTNANYPQVGDVVIVKGKVINYNGNTPEFASGKSYLLSQIRPATIAIENVASFEVGATDLTESDLDITTPSDGDITFVSGDDAVATIEANAIHAVAPGTVTITANLAATENDNALNYAATSTTFSVTVVAPATKYAITFDGNGATGGSAPTAIEDKAEGDNVTLPANSYTKTGYTFNGWKVYDENEDEVTVTANAFEMPASPVTIKAQWAEIPVWAYTYTSNVTIASNEEKEVTIDGDDYPAAKTNKGTSATITLPQGVTKIHLHLVAWKSEAQTVTVSGDCFNEDKNLTIIANDAVSGTVAKYDLGESGVDYYFSLTPDNAVAANEVITITAASNKRFVLFGVNQEGGVLPVLDHIAITGTMTNTTGWKTGDNIVPEGLTVNAIYTLNNVEQTPVEVDPNDVVWSHAALVENQTEVNLTATYTENTIVKSANVNVTIEAVETGDPTITTDVNSRSWTVDKDADIPAAKTFAVTLKNITSATITKGGDDPDAFSVTPATLTASGNITVSVVSTETVGTYTATITIKDDASETSKVVNVNLTVNAPETPETATSKTEWVVATNADLVDGAEVLIVGVNSTTSKVYAAGEQGSNNRAAVEASVDGEGVLTPGANTMSFTLVAQEGSTFALRTSNGKYLYAASSSKNYLRSQATVDDNAKWTLTATSASAEASSNNHVMQFNTGSNIFSCYSSDSQTDIQFYVPKPVVTYVAKIGETMYESLPAAVAAAQDGQTVELLMDVAAGPGVMITTAEHKQIIIDFGNHTYCANSPAVGSAGTQNQAFHFEKGCNITLQNGTITSSGNEIIMLIQNYGDLTLKNITLIGNNLPGTHRYVLSNNCGNVVIGEGTTITAKEGDVAFDVCVTNYYPEGTQVTVEDGATITGIVEYDVWGTIPADNKATLTIEGGNFEITWNVEPALAEDAKDNINVGGGIFNAEVPADYCAHGFIPVDNGSGQYGVYYAGYYERGSLTPGNYATICLPYAGKISGASLFDIEYYENSTLYLLEVEGNAMVAGRPYIFLPSSDKIEVTYTDNAGAEAGTYNGLVGSLSLVAEVIAANDGNYILYNNQYWYVNSTAYVGANRAYIHMADVPTEPSTPQVGQAPRRRVAMAVNGEQVATGIDELNGSEAPAKVLINGQLFILRGEKMYDSKGQLVK